MDTLDFALLALALTILLLSSFARFRQDLSNRARAPRGAPAAKPARVAVKQDVNALEALSPRPSFTR